MKILYILFVPPQPSPSPLWSSLLLTVWILLVSLQPPTTANASKRRVSPLRWRRSRSSRSAAPCESGYIFFTLFSPPGDGGADAFLCCAVFSEGRLRSATSRSKSSCGSACRRPAARRKTTSPRTCASKSTGSRATCRWGPAAYLTPCSWAGGCRTFSQYHLSLSHSLSILFSNLACRATFLLPKTALSPSDPVGPSTLPRWSDCPPQSQTPSWCRGRRRSDG